MNGKLQGDLPRASLITALQSGLSVTYILYAVGDRMTTCKPRVSCSVLIYNILCHKLGPFLPITFVLDNFGSHLL